MVLVVVCLVLDILLNTSEVEFPHSPKEVLLFVLGIDIVSYLLSNAVSSLTFTVCSLTYGVANPDNFLMLIPPYEVILASIADVFAPMFIVKL
jgi:hypothetical protein